MSGVTTPVDPRHAPVLRDEVLAALLPPGGDSTPTIVDGTFGAGGYSRALLDAGAIVHGFDRDPDAIAEAAPMLADYAPRLTLHHARFSEMERVLNAAGVTAVDGITLDIGVSSMQLDRADRGFSFQADGPLDMRMEQAGESAADFVNTADEGAIADVLFLYGEERQSRRVARAIVNARPITRTGELASVIRRALGHKPHMPKDPATRSFQAIRIHVNRELEELQRALDAAERLLRPGGRLAIVSFHSLEDRIVKQFLKARSGGEGGGSRHRPMAAEAPQPPSFEKPDKAVRPGDAELARNPRARSATLRSATRTTAPAHSAA